MRFDADAKPIPDRRQWIPLITGLILVAAFGLTVWTLIGELRQPLLNAGAGTPAAADPALARIAVLLATVAASTPQPYPTGVVMLLPEPTPFPSPLPTATPDPTRPTPVPTPNRNAGPCPDDPSVLPAGMWCTWPKPTPTPLPVCVTPIPNDKCVVRR